MRKLAYCFLVLLILTRVSEGQDVIENPDKPKSSNHGRVLQLEELMRITDEGGAYYFALPGNLRIDGEGNLYLADEDQFLKFSPEGNFIKNMYRRGQGPGEIERYFSFEIHDNLLHVWDSTARKLILYDLEGQLIEETKLTEMGSMRFIGCIDQGYLFSKYDRPPFKGLKNQFMDIDYKILLIQKEGPTEKTLAVLPTKWWVGPGYGLGWDPFTTEFSKSRQAIDINNSAEYSIKTLDLKSGKLVRTFRRRYKRVKAPPPTGGVRSTRTIERPTRKYANDIRFLYDCGEVLWVRTSFHDEKKGILFDVFNEEGIYVDSFYFPADLGILYIKDKILYARQRDKEEKYHIVKYRILN